MIYLKKKTVDIVCLCLTLALFAGVVILNIFQTNRPTKSDMEQRKLAEMPDFSWEALGDGSYFSNLSLFISDTFIGRDKLVLASKQLDTLRGVKYSINGEDDFSLLVTPSDKDKNDAPGKDVSDKISQALDELSKKDDANPGENNPDDTTELQKPVHSGAQMQGNDIVENIHSGTAGEKLTAITLSKTSLNLTVGSGSLIVASISPDDATAIVRWSVSDKDVASISINKSGGVNVRANAVGACTLTCSCGSDIVATCEINVTEINTVVNPFGEFKADFITDGLFIYGNAVYTQAFYSPKNAEYYAQVAAYYAKLFGGAKVSVVVAPVSSFVVDNEAVKSKIADQEEILNNMKALMDSSVNFVDTYSEMYEHRDEYLYFKSDHHWTARGAYYAYSAFIKSLGETPTPLDEFDYQIKNENYSGTMYMYTYDARVKEFKDIVEAFIPRKQHTMTVTDTNGNTVHYDSCITTNATYLSFIAGDNPYTVINVPENPQDKNVLVLKDSFGNAFVPFLCEEYGNIYVVDVRHSSFNIYDQLRDSGITDIVFMNNIQAANTFDWAKRYFAAVGVDFE